MYFSHPHDGRFRMTIPPRLAVGPFQIQLYHID
jgi:hypothetical protein